MRHNEGYHRRRPAWQPTDRQRQVLDALVEGKTNAEIAVRLGITVDGAKWHIGELLSRTGVADRQALAAWWQEQRRGRMGMLTLPLEIVRRLWPAMVLAPVALLALALLVADKSWYRVSGETQPREASREDEATPTAEPGPIADLPDAIILNWVEWSAAAGSWNADVLSGDAGSGRVPLRLGYGGAPIVSPDGRFLASADRALGRVTVYDLVLWEPVLEVQTAPGVFLHVWSEDSSQVYGWREYCDQTSDRGVCPAWQRDLWRIDLQRQAADRVFVFDFSVMELEFDRRRGADRAYAIGVDTDICCGIAPKGDPFIAVLDLTRGEVIREIPLPDLLAGQLVYGMEDGSAGSFYPALVLMPDGSRLYVIDAAKNEVTVINLRSLTVERTVELHERRSALSRLGGWLLSQVVSTAEAKGGPAFHRAAEITPDGRYLLIGGTTAERVTSKDGSTAWENRPAGLMVVDTKSLTIVLREEEAAWFRLSPDGRWVLAYGSYYDEGLADQHGFGGLVAYGLKVIDLNSLKVVEHFWPGAEVLPNAFSVDSRYAYVTADGPGRDAFHRSGTPCVSDCHRVHLLDLISGEIISEWPVESQQRVLAFPPGQ